MPWALLKFIAEAKFQHGVRSVTNLIDSIRVVDVSKGDLELASVNWPLNSLTEFEQSHLPMHLAAKGGSAKLVNRWVTLKEKHTGMVEFRRPNMLWRIQTLLRSGGLVQGNKTPKPPSAPPEKDK